ncbi:MAG: potassium channel family protein [Synergistaceae bacterium]|nr:potassium channel family protein [Synergistaceae bacterium]
MSARYMKLVKGVRRGKSLSARVRRHFLWIVLGFGALMFGSAYLVWQQEHGFEGSYMDAFWTVLFTLVGQGEFATNPRTAAGRIIVFVLSIVGVALLGVVLSELTQRLMTSKLRELMGMSRCGYRGHTVICGWNERGRFLLREILAAGKQAAIIARERPPSLPANDVFFVAGSPTDEETLRRAGIMDASAAVILSNHSGAAENDDMDAKTILAALAVESANPAVYSVIELNNPENERHARLAKVDDVIYCDSLIAEITAACAVHMGISVFIRDILCSSDEGHHFAAFDVPESFEGQALRAYFSTLREKGHLPVGVIVPPEDNPTAPAALWISRVIPDENLTITLPMRAVCIVKS